jgi:hypothetical protein
VTRPLLLVLPIVGAAAVAAAGCGGGRRIVRRRLGRLGLEQRRLRDVKTTSDAHLGGFETCSGGTVIEIADLYGVPQKTPEAVAEVIAEQLAGGSGEQDSVKQGCLDAFAKTS